MCTKTDSPLLVFMFLFTIQHNTLQQDCNGCVKILCNHNFNLKSTYVYISVILLELSFLHPWSSNVYTNMYPLVTIIWSLYKQLPIQQQQQQQHIMSYRQLIMCVSPNFKYTLVAHIVVIIVCHRR